MENNNLVPRDEKGRFIKGYTGNPLGKPKGAVSKLARLREDFLQVYKEMGGTQGLLKFAKENPTEFYTMIFKMLPKITMTQDVQIRGLTYEERLRKVLNTESLHTGFVETEIEGEEDNA